MQTTIEKITPEMAESYLATMPTYQRRVNKAHVYKMSRDMKNGRWALTHQGIAFNEKGEMFDGQHRMHAVILSDATVEMTVFRNVPEKVWHHTDIGKKRDLEAITGIQKKEVETYRSACDFGMRLRDPSYEEIEKVQNSILGEAIRDLLVYAPTTRRIVSSSAVRLVVAIWRVKSKSMYPFDQYRALTLSQYNLMSQASQSLNRQVENSISGTRKITTYDMAARAYRVFDPSASELSKIQVADLGSITTKIGMDVRELIEL